MNENNPIYKKAYFQCARRAVLENEVFLKSFIVKIVKDNYSEEKLERFNSLLTRMYDNDLFDLIMARKTSTDFKDMYDLDICTDIENYAKYLRDNNITLV